MPSRLFFHQKPTVPSRPEESRSSWRDKLRWPSRSRVPSLDRPHVGSHVTTHSDKEATSSITTLTPPVTSMTSMTDNTAEVPTITATNDNETIPKSTDLWSAAYLEALYSFGDEVKSVIFKGERIDLLLTSLEDTNKELAGNSMFRRGLQRLQTPLKNFKLAVDLASPLASVEPTAATAVGVVSCVTTIAIAICGAEESLNTQIINMLEHVAIIDDCDTLGRKLDAENGIHKALVPVYRDLLNFYIAALEILTSKTFVLALVCNQLNQRLPTIVSDFVKHAALLRDRIGNATLELLTDIKTLLQDNKIQKLLGVDKDKQRSGFHSELRGLRASEACKWIIEDSEFIDWYNLPNARLLVLLGHVGCGKSVITAHVIEELKRLNKQRLPRPVICYHYCGDDERGKALHIYSSLILQLLDQQQGLKVEFDKWYERTKETERLDPAQCSTDLGNFLSTCVENLDRELFIVIDALDECDGSSRDELITLFDSLSDKTQKLKVFFSSRPLEGIEDSLRGVTKIRWNPSQERDAIIVRHTVQKNLKECSSEIQSLVTQRLSEMAQGSAIWVKLTIELIQTEKIRAVGAMETFLAHLPPPDALSQLYGKLFARATGYNYRNEQVTASALEILAAAQRPLSILELGWAVALNDPCLEIQTLEQLKNHVDEGRVLALLLPFLSQVDPEDKRKQQLKLVHQSLKELVLQDDPSNWHVSQSSSTSSNSHRQRIHQRQSTLEANLLRACVKYLLLDDFDQLELFSTDQEIVRDLGELPGFEAFGDFDDDAWKTIQTEPGLSAANQEGFEEPKEIYYDPAKRGFGEFFVYASCFWMDHFKVCLSEGLPDVMDIVKLCAVGSKRLQNWTGQLCRPDCTIAPKFGYGSLSHDPLIVISLYGPEIAVKTLLEDNRIDLRSKEFLDDSVIQTIEQIIRWGDISRLAILFRDARVGPGIRNIRIFHLVMVQWARSDKTLGAWSNFFDLVFEICEDILIQEKWGNELLCLAVSAGCLPMVKRLFEEAARNPAMRQEILRDVRRDVNPPDHHQSIGEAVWHNHVDVLGYLLEQDGIDAHLKHCDSEGYNIFHRVWRSCNPEVVSLLIPLFPKGVDERNKPGDTPLNLVVFGGRATAGRLETAKILLVDGHADVRGGYTDEPSSWYEPLRMAARSGDVAMCQVLVEVGGADPRSVLRFEDGRPNLLDAVDFKELAPSVLHAICLFAGIDC